MEDFPVGESQADGLAEEPVEDPILRWAVEPLRGIPPALWSRGWTSCRFDELESRKTRDHVLKFLGWKV